MPSNGVGRVVVIGAGPAGLSAALELTKRGIHPIVHEKDQLVGGLSRTQCHKGFRFDMGGHRFYTKSAEVNGMWQSLLGEDFLLRPRLSRIYYDKKFFSYPPQPVNALRGLGLSTSARVLASYVKWQAFPYRDVETFEHWVTNSFGKRLFEIFFKTYTEKVWGIGCHELRAEWAAQRIKNMSLRSVIAHMFSSGSGNVTSLIEQFRYPRLGPGMMWQAFADAVTENGGELQLNTDTVGIEHANGAVTHVVCRRNGEEQRQPVSQIYSSMPLTALIRSLRPLPPASVLAAADSLKFRDFLTVCLILKRKELFPDNWIYVHDSAVKVGRIQSFKNWSPHMVPDGSRSSLGLEYFCNQGDGLWTMPDDALAELAAGELETIGLAKRDDVEDAVVYRMPYAYPVYDNSYRAALDHIKDYLKSFQNLQTIGRSGLHRYNNQDHSMLTGLHAVRNSYVGQTVDLWKINGEDDYLEELAEPRTVPSAESWTEANEKAAVELAS